MPFEPLPLINAIGATAASLNAATRIVAGLVDTAKGTQARQDLLEAQDLFVSLKSQLLDLKESVLEFQEENSRLRAEIRAKEGGATEREKYERRKVGQDWVMVPVGEDEPYFCPSCTNSGSESLLQTHPMGGHEFGSHYCSHCKTSFRL